jgi:predicted transcriptional regulator
MLEAVVGSTNAERVLLFMAVREKGYAAEIAKTYGVGASMIQKQLDRMERDGLLVHQPVGRTRMYSFNPRFPLTKEVKTLALSALAKYPAEFQEKLTLVRNRPRKARKAL